MSLSEFQLLNRIANENSFVLNATENKDKETVMEPCFIESDRTQPRNNRGSKQQGWLRFWN
jgi:hypothetical protein